jgi:hypothetical protein
MFTHTYIPEDSFGGIFFLIPTNSYGIYEDLVQTSKINKKEFNQKYDTNNLLFLPFFLIYILHLSFFKNENTFCINNKENKRRMCILCIYFVHFFRINWTVISETRK